jgi:hypothetical protein
MARQMDAVVCDFGEKFVAIVNEIVDERVDEGIPLSACC